jgi:hypothetical protein
VERSCFFLVLFLGAAVADDAEARTVFAVIPRFGEFNSRLGGCKFPVRFTTGIRRQGLDLLDHFCNQKTVAWGKSTKFPLRRENCNYGPSTVALIAGRLVRVAPRFRLGSLRKIRFADAARLQSDLDLLREAHLPGWRRLARFLPLRQAAPGCALSPE